MKVLVVSHEWEAESPGGAQRSAAALARGLARMPEMSVTLASAVREEPTAPFDRPWRNADGFDEVLIRSTTDLGMLSWQNPEFADNWQRLLRELRPDLVHLHHYFHVGIELPMVVRRALPGVPVVMTLHEYLAICLQSGQMLDSLGHLCQKSSPADCAACVGWPKERTLAREDYLRNALSSVAIFITPSRFARARYLQWEVTSEVRVVPNALDLARRDSHRPLRRSTRAIRLAFIGQHTPYKGVDVLLEAIELAEAAAPGSVERLDIYGDGSDRFGSAFERRMASLGARVPSHVRFHGRYSQGELPGILDSVDAIVVPSIWWENSPVVIEEALARRVPVISSDIGGMAEKVRDGIDGWHFQAGNSAALAELLVELSRRDLSALEGMRRPVGTDDVVRQHVEIYEAAIVAERQRASSATRPVAERGTPVRGGG